MFRLPKVTRFLGVDAVPGYQGRLSGRSGLHLPELMGVRGIGILIVVFGHLLQRVMRFDDDKSGLTALDQAIFRIFSTPYAGCSILLAVSGYSLMLALHPSTRTIGKFRTSAYIVPRIIRLYPPYCLVLLTTFAFIFLTGYQPHDTNFFFNKPNSLIVSLVASLALIHDLAFGTFPRLFPPGWFVESQLQFYLIGPSLWLLYLRLANDRIRLAIGLVLLIVFALVSLLLVTDGPANLRYSVMATMPYLWTGALVADLRLSRKTAWFDRTRDRVGSIGWIGVLGVVLCSTPVEYPALRLAGLLVCLAIVFLDAFDRVGFFGRTLINRWLVRIGVACYSIYLVHLQVSQLLTSVIVSASNHLPTLLIVLLSIAGVLPVILLVSAGFYWFIERPWIAIRALSRT